MCKAPDPDLRTPRNESIYRETLLFVIARGKRLEVGNVLLSVLDYLCHLAHGYKAGSHMQNPLHAVEAETQCSGSPTRVESVLSDVHTALRTVQGKPAARSFAGLQILSS